jgi:hypothetical protein
VEYGANVLVESTNHHMTAIDLAAIYNRSNAVRERLGSLIIFAAARANDIKKMLSMIRDHHINVNIQNSAGWTPLIG